MTPPTTLDESIRKIEKPGNDHRCHCEAEGRGNLPMVSPIRTIVQEIAASLRSSQ